MSARPGELHYHCATCGRRINPGIQNVIVPLLVCADNPHCFKNVPNEYRRWNITGYSPDPARALPCVDADCDFKFPPYDESLLSRVGMLPTVHPSRLPAEHPSRLPLQGSMNL